jgi:hypothetical protein
VAAGAGRALVVLALSALLAAVAPGYPLGAVPLMLALAAYAALAIAAPRAPYLLLPALLPVLDLAPWTGRFFIDEFDLLLAVTFILAYCRPPAPPPEPQVRLGRRGVWLLGLFALSAGYAALDGIAPLRQLDLNAFTSYYSPFNGLRAAKGLFWALLAIVPLRRELARDYRLVHADFAAGMLAGVALAGCAVLLERLLFPGLFDFSSSYRVVGPFTAMHTGGAYIEGYFVLALPFVAWRALVCRGWAERTLALGVFCLGAYAMMVTYARGGYVALLIGMLILAALAPFLRTLLLRRPQIVTLALLFGLLTAVAVPVTHGEFMRGRFSAASADLRSRTAQWAQAIGLMDTSARTMLLGMGAGRYPLLSAVTFQQGLPPAGYHLAAEGGNVFLHLGPGSPLYVEQIVSAGPRRYRAVVLARAQGEHAALTVSLCEKWLLYSAGCVERRVKIPQTGGRWVEFGFNLDAGRLAQGRWPHRPLKLALQASGDGAVEIDRVALLADGRDVLHNGGFAAGLDRWFFTVDRFETWHFENTWLQLYFEQGLLGLTLFVLLIAYTGLRAVRHVRDSDFPLPALVAAQGGFLALGMLDSLFDFPRLGLLFFTLMIFTLLHAVPAKRRDAAMSG